MQKTKYTYIQNPNDDDVTKDRDKFIGGSDVGTILGLNPFSSPYELWAKKTQQIEEEDISDKLQVFLGTELENVIRKRFMYETGFKVEKPKKSFQIKEIPYLKAHIDGRVKIKGEKRFIGFEAKCLSPFSKTDFSKGQIIPAHYAQIHLYMFLCNSPYWYYAVLQGNSKYYYMKVERNDEFIEQIMLPKLQEFWEQVQTKTPPPIDGSDATTETIKQMFPVENKEESETPIFMPTSVEEYFKDIDELTETKKELETRIEEKKNNVKAYMGNNKVMAGDNYYCKWDKRFTYKKINKKEDQQEGE